MYKYLVIKEVIDDWNPLNLLEITQDEYNEEIIDIVQLLPNSSGAISVIEIAEALNLVFVKAFGESHVRSSEYVIDKCYPIALKIWSKL